MIRDKSMIKLTHLSHEGFVLNSDLIELLESTPDTVITLTTGQKLRVSESADEIITRVVEFRRACFERPCLCPTSHKRCERWLTRQPNLRLPRESISRPSPVSCWASEESSAGLILEGGHIQEIMAPTALLIVLGGTMGAVMIMTPMNTLRGGIKALGKVFIERVESAEDMIDQIVEYSSLARKNGIVALEDAAGQVADPFLRKALNLAVDGTDLQELRRMMELEIEIEERTSESRRPKSSKAPADMLPPSGSSAPCSA